MKDPRQEGIKILQELGIELKDTDAYGWGKTNLDGLIYSYDNHYCGWWNECYNWITLQAKTIIRTETLDKIEKAFKNKRYWKVGGARNKYGEYFSISLSYCEMTKEESHQKALDNLMNGGRMSD